MTGYDLIFYESAVNIWLICPTPTVNRFRLEIRRVHTVQILVSSGYEKVQLAQSTQVRSLQRACNENCFSSLGRSQGGHALLSLFFQPRYSTVLSEKSNNLLPTFSRCAAINYYTLYSVRETGITRLLCYSTVSQKRDFFSALNFIVLNLMYHALTSAQTAARKKRVATEPDQINSILERFRYDRTGCCLSSPSSRV